MTLTYNFCELRNCFQDTQWDLTFYHNHKNIITDNADIDCGNYGTFPTGTKDGTPVQETISNVALQWVITALYGMDRIRKETERDQKTRQR